METNNMKKGRVLTKEYLEKCFEYDPVTSSLTYKVRPREMFDSDRGMRAANARCAGKTPGVYDLGYLKAVLSGEIYFLHKIIWCMHYGVWPEIIDHIDGNKSNNAIENLRSVTHSENQRNQAKSRGPTTKLMGVHFHKTQNRWMAYIGNTTTGYLGTHKTLFEAACVRKSAEIEHGYHPNHGRIQK